MPVETVDSKLDMFRFQFQWNIHDFSLICAEPSNLPIRNLGPDFLNPVPNLDEGPFHLRQNEEHGYRIRNQHWYFMEDEPLNVNFPQGYKCLLDIDYVQSSTFTVGEGEDSTSWFLYLMKMPKGNLSLQLQMLTGNLDKVLNYQFSLLDSNGNPAYEKPNEMAVISPDDSVGDATFISISELWNQKDTLLAGNTLRIRMNLEIIEDLIHFQRPDEDEYVDIPKLPEPSSNLQDLWRTRKFSDILVKCKDMSIPAHKFVIASASAYLSNKIEIDSESIELTDMNPWALKWAIEWIYTGEMEGIDWNKFTTSSELLSTAKFLQLDYLTHYIFQMLCLKRMTIPSISSLVVLAHFHNAPNPYRKKIYKFCTENMEEVKDTPEHQQLSLDHPAAFIPLLYKI